MKTYIQTKNRFLLSIMFVAFVLFAVSGTLLLRHNTTGVSAEGEEPNYTYTYGNETTTDADGHQFSWSITDAENKTAKLYKVTMAKKGALVVPSHFSKNGVDYTITEMYDSYTNNQNGVFYPSKGMITQVSFSANNQITNIGSYAFYDCDELQVITIPNTITTISKGAFAECAGITDVYYNANNSVAFQPGTGLFNNSGVAGGVNINISQSVKNIPDYTFSNMTAIKKITFISTEAQPTQITNIGAGAFRNSKLQAITIPATVSEIGAYAFADNANVVFSIGAKIGSGDAEINPSYAVAGVTGAAEDTLFALYKLNSGKLATLVSLPSSIAALTLHADCTAINDDVFAGCTALNAITGNAAFAVVTVESKYTALYQIKDSKNDKLIYITSNSTEFQKDENCTAIAPNAFVNANNLTTLTITSNVAVEQYKGNIALKTVTIAEGVTSIGESAFAGCTGLTTVSLPASLTSIGLYAFADCTALAELNYNSINVAVEEQAPCIFDNAGSAGEGVVVNFGADVTTIPADLFNSNSSNASAKIKAINFADNSKVTTIGKRAFYLVSSLTSINLPRSLTTIDDQAFQGTGLTSIDIPTAVVTIGQKAFYNNANLAEVTFTQPNMITTEDDNTTVVVSLGANAFTALKADAKYYFCDHAFRLNYDYANKADITDDANKVFMNTTNNNVYLVTLYNGAEIVKTYIESVGVVITLPTADDVKKDNYKLIGWTTNSNPEVNGAGDAKYTVIADKSKNNLYAVWGDKFALTLDFTGGTMQDVEGTSTTIDAYLNAQLDAVTVPTKTGYRFDGYFTQATAGDRYYNADGTGYRVWNIGEATTLYAQWIQTYDITLDKANGEENTGKLTYAMGDLLTNLDAAMIPTRTGYTFLGYYNGDTLVFDKDGVVVADIIATGDDVTDKDANTFTFQDNTVTTLIARWEAVKYNITIPTVENCDITVEIKHAGDADFTAVPQDFDGKVIITDELRVIATPKAGYQFAENGALAVTNTQGFEFTNSILKNVSEDITFTVSVETIKYNFAITNDADSHYTITAKINGNDPVADQKVTIEDTLELTFNI
ncbi:MAG: leucine-rich repeat protein, partial [Clostridia bacterium]|nr:leucine-rich repeat protein [Clostridia bacterium]